MFSKLFKKKDESGGEFKHNPDNLWYIEGKAYDLNKFTKAHPGRYVCMYVGSRMMRSRVMDDLYVYVCMYVCVCRWSRCAGRFERHGTL